MNGREFGEALERALVKGMYLTPNEGRLPEAYRERNMASQIVLEAVRAALRASDAGAHKHTDECWEPDSGCDIGRNEKYVRRATKAESDAIREATSDLGVPTLTGQLPEDWRLCEEQPMSKPETIHRGRWVDGVLTCWDCGTTLPTDAPPSQGGV